MSLYNRNNVVYFKRPVSLFDFRTKAPGLAGGGYRNSERGIVIRFPHGRSATTPAELIEIRPAEPVSTFAVVSITADSTPTGWPARMPLPGNISPLPSTRGAVDRLASRDLRAIVRGENEGMRIETE